MLGTDSWIWLTCTLTISGRSPLSSYARTHFVKSHDPEGALDKLTPHGKATTLSHLRLHQLTNHAVHRSQHMHPYTIMDTSPLNVSCQCLGVKPAISSTLL